MRMVHLLVRFGVELAALAAFGVFGARTGSGPASGVLMVGLPLLMTVFWWLFVAPKSAVTVAPRVKEGLALLVFMLAAVALARVGEPSLGLTLAVVAVLNSIQLRVLGIRG